MLVFHPGQSAGIGKDHHYFFYAPPSVIQAVLASPGRGPAIYTGFVLPIDLYVFPSVCFLIPIFQPSGLIFLLRSLSILHIYAVNVRYNSVAHFINSHSSNQGAARNIHDEGTFSGKNQRIAGPLGFKLGKRTFE